MTQLLAIHNTLAGGKGSQRLITRDGQAFTTRPTNRRPVNEPGNTSTRDPHGYSTVSYRALMAKHKAFKAKQAREATARAEALEAKTAVTDSDREFIQRQIDTLPPLSKRTFGLISGKAVH